MISPYFEGAESIFGLGLTQFEGFKGGLGRKPENVTQAGSKSLTRPRCRQAAGGPPQLSRSPLRGRFSPDGASQQQVFLMRLHVSAGPAALSMPL